MGGDYTRFTYKPRKGFSNLLEQQGRVRVDADPNELAEIRDRRWRSETIDLMGRTMIPDSTPDAFKIAIAGASITIDRGRAYVDGIQVECWGIVPTVYEPSLGEDRGTLPLPFAQQPFFYNPPVFPAPTGGAQDLVYLDVWQREVTALEDADLLEPAIGEPDTATRIQAAWQVKVLANSGADDCSDPSAPFDALTAPSTARLSSDAPPGPPSPTPCIINPQGGYTGLENRLYRVEVDNTGGAGSVGVLGNVVTPKIKYSRDNASLTARVVSPILSVVPGVSSSLTVDRAKRDELMRFAVDDNIEILDDDVEFSMRETGTSGQMGKITKVDYANSQLTVDKDWSGIPINPARHPRIRRWDVADPTKPVLQDATPGVPIQLEEGIVITFKADPLATVHAGDYWVFSARTATGTVEQLVEEPPRGILHHYCKLAVISGGVVDDCRPHPEHEGCCTKVVFPGQDIQAAIDSLPPTGGCVCLKTGIHSIRVALEIHGSHITVHGETAGAIVRNIVNESAVVIAAPGGAPIEDVHLEMIQFQVAREGHPFASIISLDQVRGAVIKGCSLGAIPTPGNLTFIDGTGILGKWVEELTVEGNLISDVIVGILVHGGEAATIRENRIIAPRFDPGVVVAALPPISLGMLGIYMEDDVQGPHAIEWNTIDGYATGIAIGELSSHSVIVQNRITRTELREIAFTFASGTLRPVGAGTPAWKTFAIEAHAEHCDIAGNWGNLPSASAGGIRFTRSHSVVERNEFVSELREPAVDAVTGQPDAPIGIFALGLLRKYLWHSSIRDNTLTGLQGAILARRDPAGEIHGLEIASNRIDGGQGNVDGDIAKVNADPGNAAAIYAGIAPMIQVSFGIRAVELTETVIALNLITHTVAAILAQDLSDTAIQGNQVSECGLGILAVGGLRLTIRENVLERLPLWGVSCYLLTDCVLEGNIARQCAWFALGGGLGHRNRIAESRITDGGMGIGLLLEDELRIEDCRLTDLRRSGIAVLGAMTDATFSGNRLERCGYLGQDFGGIDYAVGITVNLGLGLAEFDACEVIDTGTGPDPTAGTFVGARIGIVAMLTRAARAHGCAVRGVRRDANDPRSRELALYTVSWGQPDDDSGHADLMDNHVEGTGAPIVEAAAFGRGEVLAASNRCHDFALKAPAPTMLLQGSTLTVVGNRIRNRTKVPALAVGAGSGNMSLVGNVSSNGITIIGAPGNLLPFPPAAHNVAT
jgi:Family of unknown function (DUF6519)/Right handed beta helix region